MAAVSDQWLGSWPNGRDWSRYVGAKQLLDGRRIDSHYQPGIPTWRAGGRDLLLRYVRHKHIDTWGVVAADCPPSPQHIRQVLGHAGHDLAGRVTSALALASGGSSLPASEELRAGRALVLVAQWEG